MIKSNVFKFLIILMCSTFFSLHPSASYALTCKSLLKINKIERTNLTRAEIEQDLLSIEALASMALAIELQKTRGAIGSIGFVLNNLNPLRDSKFSSIPRVHHKRAHDFERSSIEFSEITQSDKDHIERILPSLIQDLVDSSKEGNSFNKKFSKEGPADSILARNEQYLEAFINFNIDAIILNAIKMPKIPLGARLKMEFATNLSKLSFASLVVGSTLELFNPNGLFIMLEPSYDRLLFGISDLSLEAGWFSRMIANSVILHLGVTTPAQAAYKTAKLGVNKTKAYFFNFHGNGLFNKNQYDYRAGEADRSDTADIIISEQENSDAEVDFKSQRHPVFRHRGNSN